MTHGNGITFNTFNYTFDLLMGISAQQHRVYTGLFNRCKFVNRGLVSGVQCTSLSRHVFAWIY